MERVSVSWASMALAGVTAACGGVAAGQTGDAREQSAGSAAYGKPEVGAGAPTPQGQGGTALGAASAGGGTSGDFAGPVIGAGGSAGGAGIDGGGRAHDADCSSPVTKELVPFVARAPENVSVNEQLTKAREALIGSWHGIVTTPWTEPYQIVASFSWEGGYSAHCEDNSDFGTANTGCCRAFYYGSDQNSPFKHWSLTSLNPNHTVDGDIDIMFCDGDRCQPPAWQGKLRQLDYDQTGKRVHFQFWRDDGYGPLDMELERD